MTNKGNKYLQQLLQAEQEKVKLLKEDINQASVMLNDLDRRNRAMEQDLLSICEPTILKGFARLVTLRKNLKRRRNNRKKMMHAQQLEAGRRAAQARLADHSEAVPVPGQSAPLPKRKTNAATS